MLTLLTIIENMLKSVPRCPDTSLVSSSRRLHRGRHLRGRCAGRFRFLFSCRTLAVLLAGHLARGVGVGAGVGGDPLPYRVGGAAATALTPWAALLHSVLSPPSSKIKSDRDSSKLKLRKV